MNETTRKEVTKEMREFIEDLQVWANNWVDEVQQVVVEHLDELFKDEAIRYMAKKYKELKEQYTRFNSRSLLIAYEWGEKVLTHSTHELSSYRDMLYELCYKRYTREVK